MRILVNPAQFFKMLIPENILATILGKELLNISFFVFDLWMVVHFCSGIILGLFIKDWRKAFTLLILWEVFEFITSGFIVLPETSVNVLWDVAFGMFGYMLMQRKKVCEKCGIIACDECSKKIDEANGAGQDECD